ncbi:MAG: hypothetical protein ABSF75_12285, partial [Terracidiphilus sp.]
MPRGQKQDLSPSVNSRRREVPEAWDALTLESACSSMASTTFNLILRISEMTARESGCADARPAR